MTTDKWIDNVKEEKEKGNTFPTSNDWTESSGDVWQQPHHRLQNDGRKKRRRRAHFEAFTLC